MKVYDTLDLTLAYDGMVIGQHGIWLPGGEGGGIKVPFQWGGRLTKYQRLDEVSYPLELLWEEVAILKALYHQGVAPAIGEWVYFKTVISHHPGGWWADPCGAYGYQMADATKLPPGHWKGPHDLLGLVEGSERAWNDLKKPGNVVNGWVIDVHRSGWDRLRFTGKYTIAPVLYQEDSTQLQADLTRDGQFPFQERKLPYQEYLLGKWWPGEREVRQRAEVLTYKPRPDESVFDIGTQLGGFLQYAAMVGRRSGDDARLVGVDVQPEYVALARRVARACGFNICYREWDVCDRLDETVQWLKALWGRGPDHLLMLSMLKHLPEGDRTLWSIVDTLQPRTVYLETNAVNAQNPWPLRADVERRGGVYTGNSLDRNERRCYKVSRADT